MVWGLTSWRIATSALLLSSPFSGIRCYLRRVLAPPACGVVWALSVGGRTPRRRAGSWGPQLTLPGGAHPKKNEKKHSLSISIMAFFVFLGCRRPPKRKIAVARLGFLRAARAPPRLSHSDSPKPAHHPFFYVLSNKITNTATSGVGYAAARCGKAAISFPPFTLFLICSEYHSETTKQQRQNPQQNNMFC